MGRAILFLGHEKVASLTLAAVAVGLDLEPLIHDWAGFDPGRYGKKQRPVLVLADMDRAPGLDAERFCLTLRRYFGENLPILAATASRKFQDTAKLLDAGISDCLPRLPEEGLLVRKLCRWLADDAAPPNSPLSGEDEIPESLRRVFGDAGRTLGDMCRVYPGAVPRAPAFRRMAPPDGNWRGVLLADGMDRFSAGRPSLYLSWSRLHLFRVPARQEYAVREKVVLRRIGPPLAAAVDRSGAPAGPDVYSLVPAEGVPAGFLACLLNSRLIDFYFNRLPASGADSRLRPDTIKRLPVPESGSGAMAELSRIATLLAHFGPNPQGWVDRQRRDELLEQVEEGIFTLYGVDRDIRGELAARFF